MKQEVCVGGFIQNKEGMFLVVKRSDTDDYMAGMWELPGGGLDLNETPQEGLIREIKEEVGLHITVGKPLGVHTYIMKSVDKEVQRVEITFQCLVENSENITLSFEHSEYQWISPNQIAQFDFSDYIRGVITDAEKNL